MSKKAFLKFVKENPDMATKRKSKKKASPAQLKARAKFTKIMKSGGFGKKKKSKSKKMKIPISLSAKEVTNFQRMTQESRKIKARAKLNLGSARDIDKSLLLNDIAKTGISKKNQRKIVSSISKRLHL